MIDVSEERLSELAKKINILDYTDLRQGYLSLEMGNRVGLKTGYPQLEFSQFEDTFFLHALVPSSEPGYNIRRELTLEEMTIFVLVARKKFPNERLTSELTKKVRSILISKKTEIEQSLEQIQQSLLLLLQI